MEIIRVIKQEELVGINAFMIGKVTGFSARFIAGIEGKDLSLEEYAKIADFCRQGLRDAYLKPVLDGVVLSLARFCNPEMSDEDLTKLEGLVRNSGMKKSE